MLHRAVVRLKCEHVRHPGAVQMLAVILMNGVSLLKYLSHPQYLPQNKGLKQTYQGFPGGAIVKNQSANARDKERDRASIPRLRRVPGGGNVNPLQYPCLGNPRDRGTWRVIQVMGLQSQTQLNEPAGTHGLSK